MRKAAARGRTRSARAAREVRRAAVGNRSAPYRQRHSRLARQLDERADLAVERHEPRALTSSRTTEGAPSEAARRAPNPKHQIPRKYQVQRTKIQNKASSIKVLLVSDLCILDFGLPWDLVLG